jgi:hypothetical protein
MGKTGAASLHAGQLTLLINQSHPFSLFEYMLESPKLIPFALQQNQAVFYTLTVSDLQISKPVSQDTQLWRSGSCTLVEPRPEAIVDMHFVTYSS